MKYENLSSFLTENLNLDLPPVAFTKVDNPPPGIKEFKGEVPSACTFWRKAEKDVFYASAEKHYHCPIGAMTMGFPLPNQVMENLQMVVGKMCECSYFNESEAAKLPTIKKSGEGIVYGPVSIFPIKPDGMILWLTASNQMILNEAMGCSDWRTFENYNLTGRPGCAALPRAINNGTISYSLGCIGMRTFTNIDENYFLTVIPEPAFEEIEARVGQLVTSNRVMKEFYESHKQSFATV